jgi:hypothetical protein
LRLDALDLDRKQPNRGERVPGGTRSCDALRDRFDFGAGAELPVVFLFRSVYSYADNSDGWRE